MGTSKPSKKRYITGSLSNSYIEILERNKQATVVLASACIVALAVIVPIAVYRSLAATASASLQPESGNRSALATVSSDPQASGQQYVQFGSQPVSGSALTVNASAIVAPFNPAMKGFGLGNWTFNFGRPYMGQVQGLVQAMQGINPGLIRYAGGLKGNYIGFDRTQAQPVFDSDWTKNGQTYAERYGTAELASLNSFATSIGAKVMIQVNVTNNDPSMWADLVRYAKEQNWTSFKYYEFGNELDLESANNSSGAVTPAAYGQRVAAYQTAMLAVDPTITLVGGVPAAATDIVLNNWGSGGGVASQYITQALSAAHAAGHDIAATSFHWYQNGGSNDTADLLRWSWGIDATSSEFWRQGYSRQWSEQIGPFLHSGALKNYPSTELGISELGEDSVNNTMNGNHLGALWYSDVLGRLAYNGINWVTEWDGYAASNEYYALIYPDDQSKTSPTLNARPTYDAYLMYNKYFGDQMVQSSSFDQSKISIWASKDSKDPNKLKLRITNLTGAAISAPINLSGFSSTSGGAYTMSSTNPLDLSDASTTSSAPTTINGVKINAMNVASSLAAIQPVAVSASGGTFNYTVPAYSSVAIVLSGTFQ